MKTSFMILKECFERFDFEKIQFMPTERSNFVGQELTILRTMLTRKNISLFKSTAFLSIYEMIMRRFRPNLYLLYKFFFRNDEINEKALRTILEKHEVDILIKDEIISYTNDNYCCNYRFVPIEDLFIAISPHRETKEPEFVYIGSDTFTLLKHIKCELVESVQDALEIGSGSGALSLWSSRYVENITASDINPHALELMELNAMMNNIHNMQTKHSDVFSNISGKYDIIFSNPPYQFLPEKKKGKIYLYGGELGLEVVEKILQGLDEHLKENGVAILIANSYISESGNDALYQALNRIFKNRPFSITLKQLHFTSNFHHYSFHKSKGISHCALCLIKIKRAPHFSMLFFPIRGMKKLLETLKLKIYLKIK